MLTPSSSSKYFKTYTISSDVKIWYFDTFLFLSNTENKLISPISIIGILFSLINLFTLFRSAGYWVCCASNKFCKQGSCRVPSGGQNIHQHFYHRRRVFLLFVFFKYIIRYIEMLIPIHRHIGNIG